MRLSREQAYHLRSILRQLEGLKEFVEARLPVLPSLQSEALRDDIGWLDGFIDAGTRHTKEKP